LTEDTIISVAAAVVRDTGTEIKERANLKPGRVITSDTTDSKDDNIHSRRKLGISKLFSGTLIQLVVEAKTS